MDLVEEFWTPGMFERARTAAETNRTLTAQFESEFLRFSSLDGEAIFVPTARKGLQWVLEELGTKGERQQVLMPTFLCAVVAEAALDAGKKPLLVGSGPLPGMVDLKQSLDAVRRGGVLAAVLPHLYGIGEDFGEFIAFARKEGVVIVEDCTHVLAASIGGRALGSLGDFSIHSFNFFKPMCLAGGGMLVINKGNAAGVEGAAIRRRLQMPAADAEFREVTLIEQALLDHRSSLTNRSSASLSAKIRRRVHRLPDKILRPLRSAARCFLPACIDELPAAASVGSVRAVAGIASLQEAPSVLARRRENLDFLAACLRDARGLTLRTAASNSVASPLFAKALLDPRFAKRIPEIEMRLLAAGFVGGRFHYDRTLDQQPKIGPLCRVAGDLHNAHRAAACGIDLPIHQRMEQSDVIRMAKVLLEVLNR